VAVSANPKTFAVQLVRWQRRHGRHGLPWQQPPLDIYRVWISEIMLQQTQVQTVIPYYQRFMQRFPTLEALASAALSDVLALWSGLGYYRRARHLHACAQAVMTEHGGAFPKRAEALAKLPGIGPSTAAAIASLVFHERVAILDGNVKRGLARLTCAQAPWASPALESELGDHALMLLPQDTALMPAYTQAMMDLGATICRPREPLCDACPVSMHCLAHARQQVDRYPQPRLARTLATQQLVWAIFMNAAGVWLAPQSDRGIWPGLWLPWALDLAQQPRGWKKTARSLREVITVRCVLTHRRLEIAAGVFDWHAMQPPVGAPQDLRFFAWGEALALPLPAPVKKLLLRLCPSGKAIGAAPRRNNRS
jgi:A/G-specific adenine glycosylase